MTTAATGLDAGGLALSPLERRRVERGVRIDACIPRLLLDSPISRVGALAGTVFGWVWGGMLSTGPVERRHGLWVFRGLPEWAFGRGGVCVGSCFLTGTRTRVTDRLLRHEARHAAQWRRYGLLLPLLYAFDGRRATRNRFEILAGLEDGGYRRDLSR